jgi:hypothetical protein
MLLVFPSWKGFCFGLRGPDGRDPSRGSRLLSPIHPQISPTSQIFIPSPCRKLVRARLLEQATVVSASADEHE